MLPGATAVPGCSCWPRPAHLLRNLLYFTAAVNSPEYAGARMPSRSTRAGVPTRACCLPTKPLAPLPARPPPLNVQIAHRIKIVLRPGRSGGGKGDGMAAISVTLDMRVLDALQLTDIAAPEVRWVGACGCAAGVAGQQHRSGREGDRRPAAGGHRGAWGQVGGCVQVCDTVEWEWQLRRQSLRACVPLMLACVCLCVCLRQYVWMCVLVHELGTLGNGTGR